MKALKFLDYFIIVINSSMNIKKQITNLTDCKNMKCAGRNPRM